MLYRIQYSECDVIATSKQSKGEILEPARSGSLPTHAEVPLGSWDLSFFYWKNEHCNNTYLPRVPWCLMSLFL